MKRLRQGKGPQLRLLKAADMPRPVLEKDIVDAIRLAVHRLGLIHWSGRMFVHGHRPPFLPVLGAGTPDLLGVFRDGRMWGIEVKRDERSEERQSQALWKARYPAVAVALVRSVEEAVEFLKANRG